MVINHNIPALFTHLSMRRADRSLGQAMQRLSTGLRINSAREDAAGLAIANKLNYQVGGLNRASENASHGIALIQTAEGALAEVHNMLQRMRELAVYAATDTLTNENRELIQEEINQLTTEIQLIASRSEYNRMRILNGEADRVTESLTFGTPPAIIPNPPVGAPGHFTGALPGADIFNPAPGMPGHVPGESVVTRSIVTPLFLSPAVQPGSLDYSIISVGSHAHMQINTAIFNNDLTLAPMDDLTDPANPVPLIPVGSTILVNGTRIAVREEGESDWAGFNSRLNRVMEQSGLHIPNNAAAGGDGDRFIVSNLAGSRQSIRIDVDNHNDTGLLDLIFPGSGALVVTNPNDPSDVRRRTTSGTDAVIGNIALRDVNNDLVPGSDSLSFVSDGNKVFIRGAQGEDIRLNIQVRPVTYGAGAGSLRFDFGNGNSNGPRTEGTEAPWFDGTDIVGGYGLPESGGDPLAHMSLQIRNFGPIMLQIGPSHNNAMPVQIPRLNSETLGLIEFVGGERRMKLNYRNQQGATAALGITDLAITTVSTVRARLGAFQNRLESTVSSLDVAAENTEMSRSRIQDADVARESTRLAQYNVMFQAAMAILTQANQRPQQLVSLLQ
ncbi:MAG: hypothetical protein FWB91_04205 [Defluviitaleaceae bacterium]|nr:hypothetical protein [Defluviitaleaceae bacterium]